MNGNDTNTQTLDLTNSSPAGRFLPLLLILFIGSGCSALIYEIVWFQLIQLVIGSSAVSLGVLLGTYMGGMCLGSILLPRLISLKRHPLRVYALLELGIGAMAVGIIYGIPEIQTFYIEHTGLGVQSILMRAAICAMFLLPPTLLMGATLPAIARWVEMSPRGVSWMGFFYGGNIAGAVFGCLLAGFYLLRVYDIVTATYVGVAINAAVAIIGIGFSLKARYIAPVKKEIREEISHAESSAFVYITIMLSGLSALGAEVVWTRLLSLLLGATVYTFSIILAMFLFGLGLGSTIGSFAARYSKTPRYTLGLCQMLLVAAIAWAAFIITQSLPYWPIHPIITINPWHNFQLDLLRALWVVLPAAILWGASFPLALASVVSPGKEPGRLVGGVYAANTVGAIIGALVFSIIVIPMIGTQNAHRVLMGISGFAALLMFVPLLKPMRAGSSQNLIFSPGFKFTIAVSVVITIAIAVMLVWNVSPTPWGLNAYGRHVPFQARNLVPGITDPNEIATKPGNSLSIYCIYSAEGMNVSIAVTERKSGLRSFHGAGKVQASNVPTDMRLQRMLGHIPALIHENPKSVLVVACGTGVTAGSFVPHPSVERIVICEIEPLVLKNVAPLFKKENYDVINDPRTEVIADDGRHYIETTKEKFDIITSDPIDPWFKGCAALNTIEYYTMCKEHLNPGGIMAIWVPLYESGNENVKCLISTFFKVFPNGILWTNDQDGAGYDSILFGQVEPTEINLDEIYQKLESPEYLSVVESLEYIEYDSVNSLFSTYAGQARKMAEWMEGAQINTDRNMRLQYLAGMWFNSQIGDEILDEILEYYEFPYDIFSGSEEHIKSLRTKLMLTRE
ncbi:SAM-dependent methyltransferase [Planctomycetota bacterium]